MGAAAAAASSSKAVPEMPLLVPVGEALDAYMPELETLTEKEAEDQAFKEKELVNLS